MISLYTKSNAAFSLPPARPLSPPSTSNLSHFARARRDEGKRTSLPTPITAAALSKSSIHQDEECNCVFGKKEYWDQMYGGKDETGQFVTAAVDHRPSDAYSWYCGWDELQPFWTMLVPDQKSHVVIAGIGNDPAPVRMYDAGWTTMMGYDYSQSGVDRARELFGVGRDTVDLITADARKLPLDAASVGATLDKGTLDAIYITGKDIFRDSVEEMGRVTATDGCVVSISTVIGPDDLLSAFDNPLWECVHDGSLAFAPDGEATIDLGAELYSW
eukprot:CAMPEP_0172313088 /NCGR_PEP_ID=MMETSP1058-20130122/19359_1 /TAXON_ID=83371 /ORGANISM="Detonula confervacea, Strain CCMP 353" /LENGTH=272 /DNA_ID=CAMNT_0013026685 /DNA_START=258 /DNA_END=1073 /DNA_ORIENTATION=-